MTSNPLLPKDDHDLLITLNERVSNMIIKLDDILEAHGILSGDHEDRIRRLEQHKWMIAGGLIILNAAIGYALVVYFH